MKRSIDIFAAAQVAAAFAMFPTLTPPRLPRSGNSGAPYHRPGANDVLMDWDLPKGKRARRRAKRRLLASGERGES